MDTIFPKTIKPLTLEGKKQNEKVREITKHLEETIESVFDSDKYKEYLAAMSKFHKYSLNNSILIAMQGGDLVKGFKSWENDFDRHVKAGEKAIKIFAPAIIKYNVEVSVTDPATGKPKLDENGEPVKVKKEIEEQRFHVVNVFDISQTEGKPLPLIHDTLIGDVKQFDNFIEALKDVSPADIRFDEIPGTAHGYFNIEKNEIVVDSAESEFQVIKTTIHEIAHAVLHNDKKTMPDPETREVQAESVAYTICNYFGLDTSDYSFGYIANWSSDRDTKELKKSLEIIHKTSSELITTIEDKFLELEKESQKSTSKDNKPPEIQPKEASAAPDHAKSEDLTRDI